jgi:ketosteroid isomerase-like protein
MIRIGIDTGAHPSINLRKRGDFMTKSTSKAARILIAGLVLCFGICQAFSQKEAGAEGVRAASKAFYAALAVLDDGTAMSKVWAHRPYVTFVGPRSKAMIVGWDAQKKYWVENNKNFELRKASIKDAQVHVNGNLAWEMGVETGDAKLKNANPTKVNNFVTGVYERIDGRWLKVSHHAQPIPQ